MSWRAIFAFILGLCLAAYIDRGNAGAASGPGAGAPVPQVGADVRTPDLAEVTKLIMEGTNKFRKQEGRGELKSQEQLVATARDFARYLAQNEKLSHEADGSDPRERAKKHDYHPCIVAENIAYQYNSEGFQSEDLARQFLDGWKKSPGHRKNLLDPYLLEAGMAVARSKESSKYYAVQVFGRPETAAIEFSIANQTNAAIEFEIGELKQSLKPHLTATLQPCVPYELKISWPDSSGKPQSFQTAQGDRFVVTRKQGKFHVVKHNAAGE